MTGGKGRRDKVPAPAIGGKAMNTKDGFSLPFPHGLLDSYPVTSGFFHDGFLHIFSPDPDKPEIPIL
jgi:hypothetical protein